MISSVIFWSHSCCCSFSYSCSTSSLDLYWVRVQPNTPYIRVRYITKPRFKLHGVWLTTRLEKINSNYSSKEMKLAISQLWAHEESLLHAGLAFDGTSLCSCVRGVDSSCAEHLTVESYTVFVCQQSYLLLFGISSPTHSFIPGLKPSFSANLFYRSPSFFFFRIHYMDSPECWLLLLSISVFYF